MAKEDIKIVKFKNWELWGDCANIKGELTDAEISNLVSVEKLRVIQPWHYLPEKETWLRLNSKVFKKRPDVKFHIWLDSAPIGFEFLAELDQVRDLEINQVKFKDKNTLASLTKLKRLSIANGNLTDLGFIANFSELETLELSLIKNFSDLNFVSSIKSLKRFYLNGLRNIASLPNLTSNKNLQEIVLINLKTLSNVSAIQDVKDLRVLDCHRLSPTLEPEEYMFLKKLKHLSEVRMTFNNKSKIKKLKEIIAPLKLWHSYNNGLTFGKAGPKSGKVIIDEEFPAGARITYEENCSSAPLAITIEIYGQILHTYLSDDSKMIVFPIYIWFKRKVEDYFFLTEDDNIGRNKIKDEISKR